MALRYIKYSWFKAEESGVFEILSFDELPEDLKDAVVKKRETKRPVPSELMPI